jgi:predicted NACHT family NTPase
MINYWLVRAAKRRVALTITNLLNHMFIGRSTKTLTSHLPEMRQVVVTYFQNHPDDLKLFSQGNSLHYKLNIQEQNGLIVAVIFEDRE